MHTQAHQPVAEELFNAAFITAWDELYVEDWGLEEASHSAAGPQRHVAHAIESALRSDALPQAVLNQLLSLARFMELQVGFHA